MTDAALHTRKPPGSLDRLVVTLFIAVVLHAILILGITFSPEDRTRDDEQPTLEITVVQKPSRPTEDADYLAATSQDGSGNTREKVRPQQESQASAPPPAASPVEPQPSPPPVVATLEASKATPPPAEQTPQEPRPVSTAQMMDRSLEMLSLNREINQSLQAYSKRERKTFISASTREFKYANYMNDWVTKVERVGDLNYPDEARRRGISGSLRVEVSLNADGTVRSAVITAPSGHKILDDAALRIVRLAAPYAPFPKEIREDTDVLVITRTWEFTSGNRVSTSR